MLAVALGVLVSVMLDRTRLGLRRVERIVLGMWLVVWGPGLMTVN